MPPAIPARFSQYEIEGEPVWYTFDPPVKLEGPNYPPVRLRADFWKKIPRSALGKSRMEDGSVVIDVLDWDALLKVTEYQRKKLELERIQKPASTGDDYDPG